MLILGKSCFSTLHSCRSDYGGPLGEGKSPEVPVGLVTCLVSRDCEAVIASFISLGSCLVP